MCCLPYRTPYSIEKPAAHYSCPYCPIEGITTVGEYKRHLVMHEKPAAPASRVWHGCADAVANDEKPAAPVKKENDTT